jgi:hypothetical protein
MSELNDPDIPFVDTTVVSSSAGMDARDITPLVTKTDDLSGGVNETRYVEYEEGGETKRACFKPADGENPRVLPMFAGKQTSNEVAAGIIDEELGLGLGGRVVAHLGQHVVAAQPAALLRELRVGLGDKLYGGHEDSSLALEGASKHSSQEVLAQEDVHEDGGQRREHCSGHLHIPLHNLRSRNVIQSNCHRPATRSC